MQSNSAKTTSSPLDLQLVITSRHGTMVEMPLTNEEFLDILDLLVSSKSSEQVETLLAAIPRELS